MDIADILAEKADMEQKYLKQIVKLSHADSVLLTLGDWFHRLGEWDILEGFSPYDMSMYHSDIIISIVYGAAYGYDISIRKGTKLIYQLRYDTYTGIIEDDAAKIYETITKELM